jgi:glycosyltransferase involved in cell wall biosynthesis
MNIVMMTNTYSPFVGGVEKSISSFSEEFRRRGHRVLVVTPYHSGVSPEERDVIRLPAIQHFNGTDFSVQLPIPGLLGRKLDRFAPHIIHSHHPFLIGDTALRTAAEYAVPLVYTFHTYYERYTHYVPGDSRAMKRFVTTLATGYANLCNHVIAPSESVRRDLLRRGVSSPITVIPTGIAIQEFEQGDGAGFRRAAGIPAGSRVIGFVSRLAPEKNVSFLGKSLVLFLRGDLAAHCIIAGIGPSRSELMEIFRSSAVEDRVRFMGTITGKDLADCYHAMDCFVFASQSETQGLVLVEALACGVPVVALDGPGVREVVLDGGDGLIVKEQREEAFAESLRRFFLLDPETRDGMRNAARKKAFSFAMPFCADAALRVYERAVSEGYACKPIGDSAWERARRLIKTEVEIVSNIAQSIRSAMEG